MKKYICLILSILMMVSLCFAVNAQGTATLTGADSVALGQTTELTLSLSGADAVSSVSVSVSCPDNFEVVSGTFLKSGSLTTFDTATKKGVLGGLSSSDINGALFKLVLKGKALSATGTVSVTVSAKNGSAEVLNTTASKTVGVACTSHTFSSATKIDAAKHSKTCQTCGYVEATDHTFGGGIVTQHENCKINGTMRYDCTACGATKTESIPANSNHKYGEYKVSVEATCTTSGTDERFCTVCGHRDTRTVPATGHQLQASSKVVKAATCTENGIASAQCMLCKKNVTTTILATGHNLANYEVTKKPTCTEEGVKEGACTSCGEKAQLAIEANGHFFDAGVVVKEATTTESGILKKTCTFCSATEEEPIPQLSEKPEEEPEETPDASAQPEEKGSALTWIIVAVCGGVVLVAAVVVILVVLKKKKAAKTA